MRDREFDELDEQRIKAVENSTRFAHRPQPVNSRDCTCEPSRGDLFVDVRPLLEVTRLDEPEQLLGNGRGPYGTGASPVCGMDGCHVLNL